MFRPSLGHPQALRENRSNITYMFHRNALWDPICSQNIIEVQYKLWDTCICKYWCNNCNIK